VRGIQVHEVSTDCPPSAHRPVDGRSPRPRRRAALL